MVSKDSDSPRDQSNSATGGRYWISAQRQILTDLGAQLRADRDKPGTAVARMTLMTVMQAVEARASDIRIAGAKAVGSERHHAAGAAEALEGLAAELRRAAGVR